MGDKLPNYHELKELSDREILIVVVSKLCEIENNQSNHLKHSWALAMLCLAAGFAGMTNVGIAILVLFFQG